MLADRRTVVVNMVDGETIVGRRRLSWPWQVKLTGASLRPDGREPVPLDGTVLIPRHRVAFLQVVR
jgi:hypothetical protein